MRHQEDFKDLREFVNRMNSSNSTIYKVEILTEYRDHPFIKRVLYYTYHPYFNFNVSSQNLKKREDLIAELGHDDLFNLLDALNHRKITGHSAIQQVNRFISQYKEYQDLIYQILDRNLETRATTTLINRVIPGLIPTFEVALAHDASKVKGVNLFDGSWYVSRKLDGVRCITIINGEDIKFFSRNGKEFHTLGRVKEEIIRLNITRGVLDGEVCLMNSDGSDDFQGILKGIQRKDYTIENPKYWIFDILTIEEFESMEESKSLSSRVDSRKHILLGNGSNVLELLPQVKIDGEDSLDLLKSESKSSNWEGLIARRDVKYQSGRSKDMLKIKEFYDAEYKVTKVIMGPQRVIVDGKEVEEEVLSAVIVEHNGHPVQVGSGFNMEQRRHYYKNPQEILGMVITVQYFEETVDQLGKPSLRFPVFKFNHGNSRNI